MPDKKSEVYKTEDEIREEARLRREQEEKISSAQKPKSKSRIKFDNYWYHYKWQTIAGVIAVLLICLFVNDTFLRAKPDVTIVMISERYFTPDELETIRINLEQTAWDRNGDGKVYVLIDHNRLSPDLDDDSVPTETEYAAQMKLVAVVASGTDPLYLVDGTGYDRLMQMAGQAEDGQDINIFIPESVPADNFGAAEMRFYLRSSLDGKQEYYEYCLELLRSLNK